MRTLLALRYLDHKTANLFAMIAPYVMSDAWIPNDTNLQTTFGITYGQIFELDDAGLVDSYSLTTTTFEGDPSIVRWGGRALRLNNAAGLTVPAYLLKRAGCELAKVAQVDRNPAYFFRVANWLKSKRANLEMAWTEDPPVNEALQWMPVPPDAPG
jgi:hypothetical protein